MIRMTDCSRMCLLIWAIPLPLSSVSHQKQTVGQARVLREVARQGLLPYPTFFASTRPFGTPLGPVALKYALTVLVISLLPARDAFNFLLDLASYPNLVRSFSQIPSVEGHSLFLRGFPCRDGDWVVAIACSPRK
jgi:Amino acid permease